MRGQRLYKNKRQVSQINTSFPLKVKFARSNSQWKFLCSLLQNVQHTLQDHTWEKSHRGWPKTGTVQYVDLIRPKTRVVCLQLISNDRANGGVFWKSIVKRIRPYAIFIFTNFYVWKVVVRGTEYDMWQSQITWKYCENIIHNFLPAKCK